MALLVFFRATGLLGQLPGDPGAVHQEDEQHVQPAAGDVGRLRQRLRHVQHARGHQKSLHFDGPPLSKTLQVILVPVSSR